MKIETFFENFELLTDGPNAVAKLREIVLQLAVQGKLVLQDHNDEPASALLERIESQKETLIRQQKIKKLDSSIPPIDLSSLPYKCPKNWKWVRLGLLVEIITKGSSPKWQGVNYVEGDSGILFITSENVQTYTVDLAEPKFVEARFNEIEPRSILRRNDILMNIVGASIGRTAIFDRDDIANINQAVCLIRFIAAEELLNLQYMLHFFNSPLCISFMFDKQVDSARANLSMGNIAKFPIPLPPLAEQKRIVAKVDRLLSLCNQIEVRQQQKQESIVRMNESAIAQLLSSQNPEEFSQHWQRVCNNFDLLYSIPETIPKLRQAILQLAVQGKLVSQNPNDEPASVLLERIKTEKLRLPAEGVIRKFELLPTVANNNAPFKLPKGWTWARFPELGEFGRGKSKHRPRNEPKLYEEGKYPLVQTGDVARSNGLITTYTGLYNDVGLAQSRLWFKGTLCITIAANIADSGILSFDACMPDSVVGFVPSNQIGDARYFEYFMRTAKEHLQDYAPSTAQKNINLAILETVLIPLPPLAEQKRIVAKVDRLMSLCDTLEAKLKETRSHSEKLIEVAAKQILTA